MTTTASPSAESGTTPGRSAEPFRQREPRDSQTDPRPPRPKQDADQVVAVATASIALGVVLTMLPLRSIFTDWAWLTTSFLCALPYWLIVGLLRTRSVPRWWHSIIGLIAAILMLLWVFAPQHLGYGLFPTSATFGDIGSLIQDARAALQDEHTPLVSTIPLRLLTASALVLLSVLTDVLGVVLRRPLLAAAPLLEVLAVASATSSRAAHPVWFAGAAIGFLLILISGTRLQDRAWGPSVDGSAGRLGGARRMAVTGIIAALIVPLLLPSVSVNLLARAAHHDGTGDGSGSGGQIELKTAADLRGSLKRSTPVDLLRVQVSPGDSPFYIRQAVLDTFTDTGWVASGGRFGNAVQRPLQARSFPISPSDQSTSGAPGPAAVPVFAINTKFTVLSLGGHQLPILANPADLQTGSNGVWDGGTATVANVDLKRDMTYTEDARQPAPSTAELQAAPAWSSGSNARLNDQLLALPTQPPEVQQLAKRLTDGLSDPYDKARAISDYFTNGKNGFVYSLDTAPADGRAALVTFLDKKQGFCQQYAAAAAVLMRLAGLPTRVVLGYTHRTPDANGVFTVTTSDAHAWVEVYFESVGWVAFDPTPLSGADAGRAVTLPWATHANSALPTSAEPTANKGPAPSTASVSATPSAAAAQSGRSGLSPMIWQALVAVLVGIAVLTGVVFGPNWLRGQQRKRRLARARTDGNPEPLWLEVAATAADRDALWPTTMTVGQVPDWLGRHGVDERGTATVTAVAQRVELDRFSPHRADALSAQFISELDRALSRWNQRASRRQRLLDRWIPKSLVRGRANWRR
jgi:transglutaminase-like putative cysteine protease